MTTKFLTCVLLIGLVTKTIAWSCNPDTDCSTVGIGGLVPDPIDCQRYYVCINNGGVPKPAVTPTSCPQGQFFDGTSGSCRAEVSPGICQSACGDNVCGLNCPTNSTSLSFIPSSSSCSVYYICTGGAAIPATCPSDKPYFNGIECVADQTECCNCRPHCLSPGSEIQDPCFCGSYYICAVAGQPHDINKGTCPVGWYFDVAQAQCIAGNCQNACSTCPTY